MIPPIDLIQQNAHNVAPQTIASVIYVESRGNPFAVGVNSPIRIKLRPRSAKEAADLARRYIAKGYTVDLGLMQINSKNIERLGYTIDQILEPATNIRVGASILNKAYAGAAKRFGQGQLALQAALSAYNTGNYRKGFTNGYVAKYLSNTRVRDSMTYTVKTTRIEILSPTQKVSPSTEECPDPYSANLSIYKQIEPASSLKVLEQTPSD